MNIWFPINPAINPDRKFTTHPEITPLFSIVAPKRLSTIHPKGPIITANRTNVMDRLIGNKTIVIIPIRQDAEKAAMVPRADTPPFVPGLTSFKDVISLGGCFERTPTSLAKVSATPKNIVDMKRPGIFRMAAIVGTATFPIILL